MDSPHKYATCVYQAIRCFRDPGIRQWQTTELSPSSRPKVTVDRVRELEGNGLGAVQDAPRADPDAQRQDARPVRRQNALRE
jgi:hypothetical protein